MPATPAAKRRGKEGGGGGLASKLFNKFDSDRKYDPFLDMDPIIQDSKEGMEALLSMCNAVEINSLFGALGFVVPCPRNAKEQQIMKYIRDGGRQVEKKFADVLKFFWEGLLFEYLRTVGCPLRDREHDPRHFVMRYWRRSMLDPSVRPGFVPFYAKREIKKRNNIMQEDRDIRDIRAGLILREGLVKDAEARTRGQHDYRFVLQYFSASRDLHRTLVANVNYLANEVEQLRANTDHNSESISIMEQQFVELETKYDRVVGGLVHRGAFQLTLEGTLYGMISEGHATLKAAERTANELLEGMDIGPERYDFIESPTADDDIANSNSADEEPSNSGVGSAEVDQKEGGGGMEETGTKPPKAAVDQKGEKWATPRPRAGSKNTLTCGDISSSNQYKTIETNRSTSAGENPGKADEAVDPSTRRREEGPFSQNSYNASSGGGADDDDHQRSLGVCLDQVLETHRRACTRYANQVAELEGQNAALAARTAEAVKLEGEAMAQTRSWEVRHGALEGRLADVINRSKEELDSAEKRVDEERSRSLGLADLLRETLEKATPTLMDMVAGFAPRDTESLGVDLFRSLGIEPDQYSHLLATKRMFETDLESRAFEIIDAERRIALAEAEAAAEREEEAAAAAAAATSGKKKKGERGRPKSRGKGGSGGDKAKGGGGSKSKSKGKATEKSGGGSNAAEGGAGTDKKAAAKKPSSGEKKRSSSPAKKGGAGKGSKKKK